MPSISSDDAGDRGAGSTARLTPPFRDAGSAGKLLALFILVAGIATARPGASALLASAAVAALVVVSTGASWRIFRAGLPAAAVIGLAVVPIALRDGAARAGCIAGRAVSSLTAAVAISATIPARDLAPALQSLGVPPAFAAVVAAAIRQVSVLGQEARRLLLARELRGRHGYGDGALLLGALFARVTSRAERVALAAELRGYTPEAVVPRTKLGRADVPLIGFAAVAACAVHALGRLGR